MTGSIRNRHPSDATADPKRFSLWQLHALGVVIWICFLLVTLLSERFRWGTASHQRPLLAVVLLLGAAFVIHLVALRVALHISDRRSLTWTVIIWSVVFRATVWISYPIQEIDIYRYLWDGATVAAGVSPYRYSPQQVLQADPNGSDAELARLAQLNQQRPGIGEALQRVHFPELTTVYPPVSQLVFASAVIAAPDAAGIDDLMWAMKAWLVACDMLTVLVLCALLRTARRKLGWLVAYGWCPLAIKEIANSGHLDAIVILLTTLAVLAFCRWWHTDAAREGWTWHVPAMAILLALATAAKLYPIVLVPLFVVGLATRLSRWQAVAVGSVIVALSAALLWPMLGPAVTGEQADLANTKDDTKAETAADAEAKPTSGLTTFLRRWEMNDFLFMLVVENLKPAASVPAERRAWFVATPDHWRENMVRRVESFSGLSTERVPFLIARATTLLVFAALAIGWAWRAYDENNLSGWLEAAFLTLAWFWLLCPTQNPWYWLWALPLIAFARARSWLLVSGLVLVYYVRFWLSFHFADVDVLGTGYNGERFFDFVVTWVEFGPWFLLLGLEWLRGRRR